MEKRLMVLIDLNDFTDDPSKMFQEQILYPVLKKINDHPLMEVNVLTTIESPISYIGRFMEFSSVNLTYIINNYKSLNVTDQNYTNLHWSIQDLCRSTGKIVEHYDFLILGSYKMIDNIRLSVTIAHNPNIIFGVIDRLTTQPPLAPPYNVSKGFHKEIILIDKTTIELHSPDHDKIFIERLHLVINKAISRLSYCYDEKIELVAQEEIEAELEDND